MKRNKLTIDLDQLATADPHLGAWTRRQRQIVVRSPFLALDNLKKPREAGATADNSSFASISRSSRGAYKSFKCFIMNFTYINNASSIFCTGSTKNVKHELCLLSTKEPFPLPDDSEFCRWLRGEGNCGFLLTLGSAGFCWQSKQPSNLYLSKSISSSSDAQIACAGETRHSSTEEGEVFNNRTRQRRGISDILRALSLGGIWKPINPTTTTSAGRGGGQADLSKRWIIEF